MKTKFFCICFALLSFAFYAVAQETAQSEIKTPGYNTAFKHSGAGENWFIHIGAGGQMFLGDNDLSAKVNFGNRVTLMPEVAIGKWFNPYWALRLKGQGGSLHGFEDNGLYVQHLKYYNLHLDAMWNWANYWGAYSPSKLVSFGPYIGLGLAHRFELDKSVPLPPSTSYGVGVNGNYHRYSNVISLNSGLNLGFNLSKRVNLDFDFGVAVVPDYFDRMIHDAENEAIVAISGGITFKLGKTDFDGIVPMDYALIDDLNGKINALRAENSQLSKRPVSCPECPDVVAPVVKPAVNYVPNVVFFRLNSDRIDQNQQISVYNTAEFVKNTGEKIKVIGYADKGTGTSTYNLNISKRRAQAVAKELTTKYKIPSEKITVEWKGSGEQPYPQQNNWNRVVIMSAPQ